MQDFKFDQDTVSQNADQIIAKIQKEADNFIAGVLAMAEKESRRIIEDAQKQAESKKLAILKDADKEIATLKENIFSTVNLEKKRIILQENDKLINMVFENAKKESQGFRNSAGYTDFLKSTILEGAEIIAASNLVVHFSYLDEGIFSGQFIKDAENSVRLKFKQDIFLEAKKDDFSDIGVELSDKDGHCFYDGRFLARLKRIHDEIYADLLKEVF